MRLNYTVVSNYCFDKRNIGCTAIRKVPGRDRYLFVLCDSVGNVKDSDLTSRFVSVKICKYWMKQSYCADCTLKIWTYCMRIKYLLKQYDKRLYPQKGLHYNPFSHLRSSLAMVSIKGYKAFLFIAGIVEFT